jgi:hypothetical protein
MNKEGKFMETPQNPIAAVTHPDPYPYYAKLLAEKPFYYDLELEMWVASGAEPALPGTPFCRTCAKNITWF